VLVLVLALAGCGGSAGTSSTAASAMPSSNVPGATVPQFASEVAQLKTDWEHEYAKLSSCVAPVGVQCGLEPYGIGLVSGTTSIKVQLAIRKLGSPPPSIAELLTRTQTEADSVKQAADGLGTGCIGDSYVSDSSCQTKYFQLLSAASDLHATFAGWQPYGVS
jgi:hypothetical protein